MCKEMISELGYLLEIENILTKSVLFSHKKRWQQADLDYA